MSSTKRSKLNSLYPRQGWVLGAGGARRRRIAAVGLLVSGAAAFSVGAATGGVAARAAASAPGSASAQAAVLSVVAQTGGAPFTVNIGESSAAYVQTEAEAKSAVLDLGGLGFVLSELPLCGQFPIKQSDLPQVLSVDTATSSGTQTVPGNVADLGTETVSANPSPESAYSDTEPGVTLESLISVTAKSYTAVSYDSNSGQQHSTATVTEDVTLAGGLVELDGLTWTATDDSGAKSQSTAEFDIGRVKIGPFGQSITLPSGTPLNQVIQLVNNVLGPIGLSISLPSSTGDTASGKASETPLNIHFNGTAADQIVLGPVSQLVGAVQNALKGVSTNGSDCSQITNLIGNVSNIADTLIDLVLGIAQGAGGLDINLGGVNTQTAAATAYTNPLDGGGGGTGTGSTTSPGSATTGGSGGGTTSGGGSDSVVVPSGGGSTGSGTAPSASSPDTGSAATSAPPGDFGTGSTGSTGASGNLAAVAVHCKTTSPAGSPGCWKGIGVVVGAITLVGGAAMLAADVSYGRRGGRRRRRRVVPD